MNNNTLHSTYADMYIVHKSQTYEYSLNVLFPHSSVFLLLHCLSPPPPPSSLSLSLYPPSPSSLSLPPLPPHSLSPSISPLSPTLSPLSLLSLSLPLQYRYTSLSPYTDCAVCYLFRLGSYQFSFINNS